MGPSPNLLGCTTVMSNAETQFEAVLPAILIAVLRTLA